MKSFIYFHSLYICKLGLVEPAGSAWINFGGKKNYSVPFCKNCRMAWWIQGTLTEWEGVTITLFAYSKLIQYQVMFSSDVFQKVSYIPFLSCSHLQLRERSFLVSWRDSPEHWWYGVRMDKGMNWLPFLSRVVLVEVKGRVSSTQSFLTPAHTAIPLRNPGNNLFGVGKIYRNRE